MGNLGLAKNKKYKQGYYYPKNKDKFVGGQYAIYRSGLELAYFKFLDENTKCLKWGSENFVVPYYFDIDKRWHKYYIDLVAVFKDKGQISKYLIEIKPERQTKKPALSNRKRRSTLISEAVMYDKNQAKWAAADKFAKSQGFKFVVLTEKNIGYSYN